MLLCNVSCSLFPLSGSLPAFCYSPIPPRQPLTPLPSVLGTLFQIPYTLSPLLATLTKTPGCGGILPILELTSTPFSFLIFNHLPGTHFATTLFSYPCMEWGKGVPPLASSSLPTVHYYSLLLTLLTSLPRC